MFVGWLFEVQATNISHGRVSVDKGAYCKTEKKLQIKLTIIIIIIAFKGAIQDFHNLLTAPRTVSNTYAQVARAQPCANHVQHIERLSRATCRVTCHLVRRGSSAVRFDRVEIAFI